MMRFDRITLGRQAKELGFVRDTFEKVCPSRTFFLLWKAMGCLRTALP